MNQRAELLSRAGVAFLVILVVLGTVPGLAMAAPVQEAGGTIVVAEDETVDSVQAAGGTVIVRGTVTGDVEAAAGSVLIPGTVEGDVSAGAGSIEITGQVDGDVSVGTGSLTIGEAAVIGGQLKAGAGSARIAGTVNGDVEIGAGSIVLEPTATFQGDVRYDGDLDDQGATIEGELVRDSSISQSEFRPFGGFGSALFDVYGFLVNLVLGAVLLLVFPGTSRRLASRLQDEPLSTGLYGLVALVGIPILLILMAITIIGIPLAVVGALLFALTLWVGSIYGRYTVGEWLVGYVGSEKRWLALVVGLVVIGLLSLVPFLGGLVEFLVLLLGLGGLGVLAVEAVRNRRGPSAA
ncbi:MAG: polymer-forming cytoskeletal protein [Halobacteriales archaeon]